jgi:uncharacterized membrane protein
MKFTDWIREIFTDALDRPEIKNILGVPIIIAAVVYGLVTRDWVGFGALFGAGSGLLVATTVADAKIDAGA